VGAGSTDMGDVSHAVPSIHPWLAICNKGETTCHQHAFALCAGSERGQEAMLTAADARYDAVLLDIGLPDGDGRDLCARLRKHGLKVPIIMLTGADAEQDVVRGLDAGANDYIAKPFRLNELLARVRAQLRVFDNSEDAVFLVGPYVFRPAAKLLLEQAKNRKVRLTEKEAAILKFLYRNGGKPVGRQVLLNGWDDIALTLRAGEKIDAYEKNQQPWL
jgi:DNA-binding response OmpR family regulator